VRRLFNHTNIIVALVLTCLIIISSCKRIKNNKSKYVSSVLDTSHLQGIWLNVNPKAGFEIRKGKLYSFDDGAISL